MVLLDRDTDKVRKLQLVQLHVSPCAAECGVARCPRAAAAVPFGPWCGLHGALEGWLVPCEALSASRVLCGGAKVLVLLAPCGQALSALVAEAGAVVPPQVALASAGWAATS